MREILFRGKRIDNGKWAFGYIVPIEVDYWDKGFEIIDIDGLEYEELDCYFPSFISYRVIPETVGQYTGLTDKNGTKVFEGDIIEWDEKEWGCEHRELVEWNCSLFSQRKNDWKEFCEVIGNIHDNPEFLEVPHE